MLYVDDNDFARRYRRLTKTIVTITKFGKYSGLKINWSKSALMLTDDGVVRTGDICDIPLATSFKYQGIWVTPYIRDYSRLNIYLLLLIF